MREEVFVDESKRVAFKLGGQRREWPQQLDQCRAFQLLIAARQDVLEFRIRGLDGLDRLIDCFADVVTLGQVDEVGQPRPPNGTPPPPYRGAAAQEENKPRPAPVASPVRAGALRSIHAVPNRPQHRNTGVPPTNVSETGHCDVCAKKIITIITATSPPRSTMMCRACDLLLGPATPTGQDGPRAQTR